MDAKFVFVILIFVFAIILFLLTSGISCGVSRLNDEVTTIEDDIDNITASNTSMEKRITSVDSKVVNLTSSGKDSAFTKDLNVSVEVYDDGTPILKSVKDLDTFVKTGVFTADTITLSSLISSGTSTFGGIENIGNISTNSITSGGSSTIGILKTTQGAASLNVPCGYFFYTVGDFNSVPEVSSKIAGIYDILGSMNYVYGADKDAYYLVNPGFKFQTYTENGFKGQVYDYINTNGLLPLGFVSKKPFKLNSIRVYYKDTEFIPIPNLTKI